MNYKEVSEILTREFGKLPLIASTTHNSNNWQLHKDIKFPSVAFDLQNITVDEEGNASYNYMFTAAMRGVEDEQDRIDNYNFLMSTLYKGINELKSYDDLEVGSMTFNFASAKFMDVLECAICQISIITPMEVDCE